MHAFSDSKGRRWLIDLTIGAVKRCRALVGVDLLDPASPQPKSKDTPLSHALYVDPVLLIDCIWAICLPDAQRDNVSEEEFLHAIGPDNAKAAALAFYDEWRDFFRGLDRTDAATLIEGHTRLMRLELEAAVRRIEARLASAMAEAANAGPSTTAPNSPESPDSAT